MSKIHFIMISTILSSFIYYFVGLFVQYILGLHSFKYFVALGSQFIWDSWDLFFTTTYQFEIWNKSVVTKLNLNAFDDNS